jgi:hypothetical protein
MTVGASARRWSGPDRGRAALEVGFASSVLLWLLIDAARADAFASDFRAAFWRAGRHVLSGESPYPAVIDFGRLPFVYPAPAAILFAPFGLLPEGLAAVLFMVLLVAALLLTLHLCGVSDPRCYALALLWAPVFSAVQTANLTLLLALGVAAVWRFRERPLTSAVIAGVLVSLKIFLWPIMIWLAVRQGVRKAGASACVAALTAVGSWAIIGFAGFADYPHLVRQVSREEGPGSYSVTALLMRIGLGQISAMTLALALGLGMAAVACRLARREGDGRWSFALTIAAVIVCTPVVWLHYYALFVVALALVSPQLKPEWLLPLLLWPCPVMMAAGPSLWPLAPFLVFAGALGVALHRERAPARSTVDTAGQTPAAAMVRS